MTNEKKLHEWLRAQTFPCDYCRIEGSFAGIPDVTLGKQGLGDVWIELKIVTSGRTLMRKEQYAWCMRRSMNGGRVMLVSWHVPHNAIHFWKFPHVEVEQYSKYVSVLSRGGTIMPLDEFGKRCETILFRS